MCAGRARAAFTDRGDPMNRENPELSRRRLLSAGLGGLIVLIPGAAALSGCRRSLPGDPVPAQSAPPRLAYAAPSQDSSLYTAAPATCQATATNIEGPYYR